MADLVSEIYLPGTSDIIRDQFLRDVRLAAIDSGVAAPPVTPGTDWFFLGTAVANISLIGLQNIQIGQDNTNLLTCTGDALQNERKARGLPELPKAGSSGKIIVRVAGNTTIANGTQGTLPNGKRWQVTDTFVNPADRAEISIEAIDTGEDTNFPAGTVVRFRTAPSNVEQEATVSAASPLTGGTDGETDERLRSRILNSVANVPAGGNWGMARKIALEADGSIQDAFIHPSLGGPGSLHVVCVKKLDQEIGSFTRACSAAQTQRVLQAMHVEYPAPIEVTVGTVADDNADFAFSLELPDSAFAGGSGDGWIDATPWPALEVADAGVVAITSATSSTVIVVDAQTATAPVAMLNTIAWWSSVDRKFRTSVVQSSSGSAGAWTLTLVTPLLDSTGALPAAGDYISPAAKNIEAYGYEFVELFNGFGPAEMTTDADRLPRAKRHPFTSSESPSDWSDLLMCMIQHKYPEITNVEREYALLTTPTVSATVDTAPGILTPRHLAFYQL